MEQSLVKPRLKPVEPWGDMEILTHEKESLGVLDLGPSSRPIP